MAAMNANRDLETLLRLGTMSTGIAHELNQPLCAVANYAQACNRLLDHPNPDMAEIRDSLHEIASQALRAADVIRRLRSLTRPRDEHQEVLDVNMELAALGDYIGAQTAQHHVRFRLEQATALPGVRMNRPQFQQLVLNLVRNAIDAQLEMPASLREVVVRTTLAAHDEIEISVMDRGPGVAPGILPHLFEPFCTSKPNGTGLGLAMSRNIARVHKGKLSYRPGSPTGACFTLTLPIAVST